MIGSIRLQTQSISSRMRLETMKSEKKGNAHSNVPSKKKKSGHISFCDSCLLEHKQKNERLRVQRSKKRLSVFHRATARQLLMFSRIFFVVRIAAKASVEISKQQNVQDDRELRSVPFRVSLCQTWLICSSIGN